MGRRCLFGKLFSDKIMNKTVVQTMMSTVWKISGEFTFTVVGENVSLIEFALECDRDIVKHGCPWLFDRFKVYRTLMA